MSAKQILATIVLSVGLLNRTAIAAQLLESIRADDPEGAYMIKTRSGADSLVPREDEDWEFAIVRIPRVTSLSDKVDVTVTIERVR